MKTFTTELVSTSPVVNVFDKILTIVLLNSVNNFILFFVSLAILKLQVAVFNPLNAGRRLTDFSQTSYAAGGRLTYCTVNQRSGS